MHHSMLREKARRISNKEKLFKEIRKKTNTAKVGPVMRLRVDFSVETLQARQEQNDFLKVLNDKKCQPEKMALLLTILKQFGFSQSRSCIRSFPLQNELSQSHLGGFKQSPHKFYSATRSSPILSTNNCG